MFAYAMGQFAELMVERAVRANEFKLMSRPLTEAEFRFAYEMQRGKIADYYDEESSSDGATPAPMFKASSKQNSNRSINVRELRLDLGDFIVLELLRLQKITQEDLEYIKMVFELLDDDGDGVLINQPAPAATGCYNTTTTNAQPSAALPYSPLPAIPESPADFFPDEESSRSAIQVSADHLSINTPDSTTRIGLPAPLDLSNITFEPPTLFNLLTTPMSATMTPNPEESFGMHDDYNQKIISKLRGLQQSNGDQLTTSIIGGKKLNFLPSSRPRSRTDFVVNGSPRRHHNSSFEDQELRSISQDASSSGILHHVAGQNDPEGEKRPLLPLKARVQRASTTDSYIS